MMARLIKVTDMPREYVMWQHAVTPTEACLFVRENVI